MAIFVGWIPALLVESDGVYTTLRGVNDLLNRQVSDGEIRPEVAETLMFQLWGHVIVVRFLFCWAIFSVLLLLYCFYKITCMPTGTDGQNDSEGKKISMSQDFEKAG